MPIDSDAKRAYCAAMWATGVTQKRIAREMGYKAAPPVCVAIERFIKDHLPDVPLRTHGDDPALYIAAYGERRRKLAEKAVRRWHGRRVLSLNSD